MREFFNVKSRSIAFSRKIRFKDVLERRRNRGKKRLREKKKEKGYFVTSGLFFFREISRISVR